MRRLKNKEKRDIIDTEKQKKIIRGKGKNEEHKNEIICYFSNYSCINYRE